MKQYFPKQIPRPACDLENIPWHEMTATQKAEWDIEWENMTKPEKDLWLARQRIAQMEKERVKKERDNESMLKAGMIFLAWLFAGCLVCPFGLLPAMLWLLGSPFLCFMCHERWTNPQS